MKIFELKRASLTRLRRYGKRPYKLAFYSVAIALAVQLLVSAMGYWVTTYQGGEGLDGMGSVTMIQTVHELLSIVVSVLSPLWTLGFTAAIMAFMDWQDPQDTVLLKGLRHWWDFLKLYFLEGIFMFLVVLAVILPVTYLYALTPWAKDLANIPDPEIVGEVKFVAAAADEASPLIIIYVLALIAVLVPISYRLRFTNYLILNGWIGVFSAMVTSFQMTKGYVWSMIKLDLSFWWYYLVTGLLALVYAAVVMLGLDLGFSFHTVFWLCCVLFALGVLALDVFAKPRIVAANVLLWRSATGKD